MGMIYLLSSTEREIDINEIIQAIDNLNEKIMLIDSNVKFNFTMVLSCIGIFIAILSVINWLAIKKHLEKKAEEYIEQRLDEIISKVNQYKTIYGKKYLNDIEYNKGTYSFEIGSDKLNIKFKKTGNKIDVRPIKGVDKLDYKAEVLNGKLRIKFKNFNKEEHKGIEWKITYIDE